MGGGIAQRGSLACARGLVFTCSSPPTGTCGDGVLWSGRAASKAASAEEEEEEEQEEEEEVEEVEAEEEADEADAEVVEGDEEGGACDGDVCDDSENDEGDDGNDDDDDVEDEGDDNVSDDDSDGGWDVASCAVKRRDRRRDIDALDWRWRWCVMPLKEGGRKEV